jgi:hypothetical protein
MQDGTQDARTDTPSGPNCYNQPSGTCNAASAKSDEDASAWLTAAVAATSWGQLYELWAKAGEAGAQSATLRTVCAARKKQLADVDAAAMALLIAELGAVEVAS